MKLTLCHLYPSSMSTYGDSGNVRCLVQRCAWRGITLDVHGADIGDDLPERADLYFFGGGQDAAQESLGRDLLAKADRLRADVASGVPLLAICGGYQLLGRRYLPFGQEPIEGVGVFPVETAASHDRMIGNLIIETDLGAVVGFENHSGKTTFTGDASPLGTVRHGFGNNGSDKTEGCRVHNAIGCYLHGPVLPKNPLLADWLILQAIRRHHPDYKLEPLDDSLELQAHAAIVTRYS